MIRVLNGNLGALWRAPIGVDQPNADINVSAIPARSRLWTVFAQASARRVSQDEPSFYWVVIATPWSR